MTRSSQPTHSLIKWPTASDGTLSRTIQSPNLVDARTTATMPFRIAAGRPDHASMISIRFGSALLLSWIQEGARVCLFGAIGLLSRRPRALGAGLKIRCSADRSWRARQGKKRGTYCPPAPNLCRI